MHIAPFFLIWQTPGFEWQYQTQVFFIKDLTLLFSKILFVQVGFMVNRAYQIETCYETFPTIIYLYKTKVV